MPVKTAETESRKVDKKKKLYTYRAAERGEPARTGLTQQGIRPAQPAATATLGKGVHTFN